MFKNADHSLKLILFFVAFLLYANTMGHDYAWDDIIVINDNPRVKQGFSGIPNLFLKYNSDYRADKYGYRPLVLTSFAVEYGLFGANPKAGHFMNVLWFGLLCVVLFKVLRKIFYHFSSLFPFLITLLFALHPVHVEVVANIKSRDEIFALLFSLLSLEQLMLYHQTRRLKALLFSVLLFLAAFVSKESAITFLAIMPLTLLYMEGWANFKKIISSSLHIPVLLAAAFIILKLYMSSSLGKEASKGAGIYYESNILGNSFFYISVLSTKFADAFTILLLYLKNFFFPVTQLYYYGYNQVPVASWQQPLVIASCLLHIGLLAFAILNIRKKAELSYGIFFYFISISVYTHIAWNLSDTMADRFLFSPSLGLCVVTVFVLGKLFKADYSTLSAEALLGPGKNNSSPGNSKLKYAFLIIALLLSIKTFTRNKVWKNNETLVTHDMPALENCSRAHYYYADMLKAKLRSGYDAGMEADMIAHFQKSYHISKEAYYAYMGLGTYLCNAKKFSEGIAVLDSMTRIYPEQADPNFYLGQAYYDTQQYKKAVYYLERSLRLAPEVRNTYYFMALAYSRNGDYEKAISTTRKAREKFSESASIYDALANIYFDKGELEQSTRYMLEMLRFGENPEKVYGTVIGRYQVKKQDSLAAFYYRQARAKGLFNQPR